MSNSSSGKCVVFLDIDGVVVPVSPMCFGGGDIDPSCLQKLKQIIEACGGPDGVTIVLSSTWRHDPSKIERLNKAFDSVGGIPHTTHGVPDGTAHAPTVVTYLKKDPQEQKLVRDRVDEIYEWMETHKEEFPEAARGSRWFAIDDMNLAVDARMKGHFVKSDTEDGLQSADVTAAKAMIAELPAYATTTPTPTPAVAAATAEVKSEQPPSTTTTTTAVAKPLDHTVQEFAPRSTASSSTLAAPNDASAAEVAGGFSVPIATMTRGEALHHGVDYVGVVKRYNPNRGFGFITAPNNEDVFLHQSMISHLGFRAVNVGELVSFQILDEEDAATPKASRRQAIQVRQLSPYIPTNIQKQMMSQWDLYQPYVAAAPPPVLSSFGLRGGRGSAGRKRTETKEHVDPAAEPDHPNNNYQGMHGKDETAVPPYGRGTGGAPHSQYHGPGTRGRGSAHTDLPLIPDGFGYRSVNGTVFFPAQQPQPDPTVSAQQQQPPAAVRQPPAQTTSAAPAQRRRMPKKATVVTK